MPIFTQWWFWLLIIGFIAVIIGVILLLATSIATYISIIIIVLAILLVIVGIIFWIRYARKPKPQQSITQKILTRTPGVAEMYYVGERSGINKAVSGGASAIYNTSKNVGSSTYNSLNTSRKDPKNTKAVKYATLPIAGAVLTGAASGAFVGPLAISPAGPIGIGLASLGSASLGAYGRSRGKKINTKRAAEAEQAKTQAEQLALQNEQQQFQQQYQRQYQQQELALRQKQIEQYNQLGSKLGY